MSFTKEEMDITDKLGSMLMKFDPKVGLRILDGRIAYHSGESREAFYSYGD